MVKSRHQNEEEDHNIRIADKFFEFVAKSKYFGTTTTNQNLINPLKPSGNYMYHPL
jgi:hypothetical protein